MNAPAKPFVAGSEWSLWDVLKESAEAFVDLGEAIYDACLIYMLAEMVETDDLGRPKLTQKGIDALLPELTRLFDVARRLNLAASMRLLGRRVVYKDMPNTKAELDLLVEVIKDELNSRLFLFVPEHRAPYYEKNDLLSDPSRKAFPLAGQELREAANAYAFGLPTASVFHSMRALEHGLRALATEVGKTFDVQNWQNIIDEIESEIGKQGKALPRGAPKSERLQFLGSAAKEFTYFKDGWRNYVSHGKASYGEQQALTVMSHTRDFLDRLAEAQLHE